MNKMGKKLKKNIMLSSRWMYLVQAKAQWLNLVYMVTNLGVPKMVHNFSTKRAILLST